MNTRGFIAPIVWGNLLVAEKDMEKRSCIGSDLIVRVVVSEKRKSYFIENVFGKDVDRKIRGHKAIFVDNQCLMIVDELKGIYWTTGNMSPRCEKSLMSALAEFPLAPAKIRVS